LAGAGKGFITTEPYIWGLGPNVETHSRHFRQQSRYTVCLVEHGGGLNYAHHKYALGAHVELNQDLLWKFTIPYSERDKALSELNLMNINAYSLFDTEEALLEMLYQTTTTRSTQKY
jgi:hypothetical protein